MTATTARLVIGNWQTTLILTDANRRQVNRHNLLGDDALDGDWHTDSTNFFLNAADRQLTEAGYSRTGPWEYDPSRNIHSASIAHA
ncbi:hypothetical protein ACIBCR_15565 [Micromonospora echinospora]|uniref:hypothetical protein n=1 Tax=Micromonospora echinospora TaxID=1877 RepID=UPI00378A677F